jgi:processive rubber oxygenase RoxA-like protein
MIEHLEPQSKRAANGRKIFANAAKIIGIAAIYLLAGYQIGCAQTAPTPGSESYRPDAVYLDQGWTHDTSEQWYHLSQGTVFMPAEWFVSLEQASGTALFASSDHLARLGFLPDPPNNNNPFGLPVGFAVRDLDFPNNDNLQHYQNWKGHWVGFTCAACHTGQINSHGQKIRIEGGTAHLDIEGFGDELSAALAATATSIPKFTRFAQRVLALGVKETPVELQQQLMTFIGDGVARNLLFDTAQAHASQEPTRSGFGRLDAVHRGGNLLLAWPLGEPKNYVPTTAPVRYPMLWDTPYFDWVLYNASIRQPMARNVIEDLGVGAPVLPSTFLNGNVQHGVIMDHLVQIHHMLEKLQSPVWPEEILGKINRSLAAQGGVIFIQRCAGCHQVIDRSTHRPGSVAPQTPPPTITVGLVPLNDIRTDPQQAHNFAARFVSLEKIGGPTQIPYRKAAQIVTGRIVEQWAAQSPQNAALEREIDTGRPNDFRGPQGYRSRPLNGIWAAAPYLHNGSVPSLYELLQPPQNRTRIFYVGSWEFDPQKVGLIVGSPYAGAFTLDTWELGNSNTGHDYGTNLSDGEKAALIEYLKTL